MIISGGFNIYPVDLEGVLLGLPGVEEAAVIGMASERCGGTPVGFVSGQPEPGCTPAVRLRTREALVGDAPFIPDSRMSLPPP